MQDASMLV